MYQWWNPPLLLFELLLFWLLNKYFVFSFSFLPIYSQILIAIIWNINQLFGNHKSPQIKCLYHYITTGFWLFSFINCLSLHVRHYSSFFFSFYSCVLNRTVMSCDSPKIKAQYSLFSVTHWRGCTAISTSGKKKEKKTSTKKKETITCLKKLYLFFLFCVTAQARM